MLIFFEGKDLPPECDSIAGGSGFCVAKDERGLAGEASIESRDYRREINGMYRTQTCEKLQWFVCLQSKQSSLSLLSHLFSLISYLSAKLGFVF